MKAILIHALPIKKQDEIIAEFRKWGQGHVFDWLKHEYKKAGGRNFPPEIQRHFSTVSSWRTEFRYETEAIKLKEAEAFLAASEAIVKWADGRM